MIKIPGRPVRLSAGTLILALSFLFSGRLPAEEPPGSPLAIVKQVKGHALKTLPDGRNENLAPFDKLPVLYSIETQKNSSCILRLFAAPSGQFILQPSTKIKLANKKYGNKIKPHIILEGGKIEANFSKTAGNLYILESANSVIEALGSRWLMRFGDEAVTKFVILKGNLKIYNKPKDVSAIVSEGKTCLSDKDGLHIMNSSDEDVAQFLQNLLEIDFITPSTEEIKTLEIEYESNF